MIENEVMFLALSLWSEILSRHTFLEAEILSQSVATSQQPQ